MEKLTPKQAELVEFRALMLSNKHINNFLAIADRNYSASLILYGFNMKEANEILTEFSNLMKEDAEKFEKYEKGDINMRKDVESRLTEEVTNLINEGLTKKAAITKLTFTFPTLSKSMIVTAYQRIHEDSSKPYDSASTLGTERACALARCERLQLP